MRSLPVPCCTLALAAVTLTLACAPPHAPREPAPPGAVAVPVEAAPIEATAESTSGCIDDPFAHAVGLLLARHGEAIAERTGQRATAADYPAPGASCTSMARLPDLDGDGQPELAVVEECTMGTASALHYVYLSSHGCARSAGELLASELLASSQSSEGVVDLETTVSNGCAGHDFAWTRYRWQDGAYAVVDTATCELCPERAEPRRGANEHPYCRAYADATKDSGAPP